MEIALNTPLRATIEIEKNKSDAWNVTSYLITADGARERRSLGVFETHAEATQALKRAWTKLTL
jgi:hypothetical protein